VEEQQQDDDRERKILCRQRVSVDAITLDIIIKSIMLNQNEMKTLAFFIFANEIRICARFKGGANAHTANIQAEEFFSQEEFNSAGSIKYKTLELLKRSQNKWIKFSEHILLWLSKKYQKLLYTA
jgi:hypothetical protein